jgi:fibrillarin-like rRNA methylase
MGLTPIEQLSLEPYARDHAVVSGTYRWMINTFKFI